MMKETFKQNLTGFGLAVLFAGLLLAVIVFRPISPALAQGDDLPKVQSGSEWNDLSSENIHPTFLEVKEKYQAVVPKKERDFAARRINHILSSADSSAEYANNLLPLKEWQGKNVFLVRRKIDKNIIQIIEGNGKISIEIRKVDGGYLDESKDSNAEKVKILAKKWLPADLQPIDFHAVNGQEPRVATWLTERKDNNDEDGVRLPVCDAYFDGHYCRYEFVEFTPKQKSSSVTPYLFIEPIEDNNKTKETVLKNSTRLATEAQREISEALETKNPLTSEERVNVCIKLLKKEMDNPSLTTWGYQGGPIDTGYVQEVIMGSVCTFSQRGKVQEEIRTILQKKLNSDGSHDNAIRDRIVIMLGSTADRKVIPELVDMIEKHPDDYIRVSAALALNDYPDLKSIQELQDFIPRLKKVLLSDNFARFGPQQSNRVVGNEKIEVYSPIRRAIWTILRELGEQPSVNDLVIEKKYGTQRVEPLLHVKTKLVPEKTADFLFRLGGDEANSVLIKYLNFQANASQIDFTPSLNLLIDNRLLSGIDKTTTVVGIWEESDTRQKLLKRIYALHLK